MYNVITAWGNYPTRLRNGKPGPHTEEELGLMWLKHVAQFSLPGMLKKYRLVLILPRDILIPDTYNLDLDQWGDKKRFDENNKLQPWPMGQNMTFQQILWLHVHKKLEGPFLWCEPDCIPVKPDWLDMLFGEYERSRKPFMGGLVESFVQNGVRVPKHMTGNGIYPGENSYRLAPTLMECRGTAWDVYAANQILQNFHDASHLIQHDLEERNAVDNSNTVLYHPDKEGRMIPLLSGSGHYERPKLTERKTPLTKLDTPGKPLVEVLSEPLMGEWHTLNMDEILEAVKEECDKDKEIRKKVAYFMLDNGIVNSGHWGQHLKKQRRKEREAESAESAQ